MIELFTTTADFLSRRQGLVSSFFQYPFFKWIDRRHRDHLRFRTLHASYREWYIKARPHLQAGQTLDSWPPTFQAILLEMSALSGDWLLRRHIRQLLAPKSLEPGKLLEEADKVLWLSGREFRR